MLNVYISSPVSAYQTHWNTRIAELLRSEGHLVYLPQEIGFFSISHTKLPLTVFEKCCEMIVSSDFGLLLLPYGRDCAWEVGYYRGLNKPLYVYAEAVDEVQKNLLRDWMIKGSIDDLFTTSPKTLSLFSQDPILQNKRIHYLPTIYEFPKVLSMVYALSRQIQSSAYLGVGAVVIRNGKVLLVQEEKNSPFYLRKQGMWGYPTKLFTSSCLLPQQSLRSLVVETNLVGSAPLFVSQEAIPNAVGLFYKVSVKHINNLKNGQWFSIEDIMKERVYLRPTYVNVLRKLLGD